MNQYEMEADELRHFFAQDEICVLAVGWFYLFFGGALSATSGLLLALHYTTLDTHYSFLLFLGIISGFVYLILGWGMRHFGPWSRSPARFAAFVMLFIFPIGTLAGLFCYVLLRERSHETIFSNRYRALLFARPHLERHSTLIPASIGILTGICLTLLGLIYGTEIHTLMR